MIVFANKYCKKCDRWKAADDFDPQRCVCRKCKSLAGLLRHHAKRHEQGLEPGPRRITKLQNPVIWKLAKSFGLKPSVYLKVKGVL